MLTLHILLRLFIYWNVKFASRMQFSSRISLGQATDVLVLPMEFSGLPEIVLLQHRVLVGSGLSPPADQRKLTALHAVTSTSHQDRHHMPYEPSVNSPG